MSGGGKGANKKASTDGLVKHESTNKPRQPESTCTDFVPGKTLRPASKNANDGRGDILNTKQTAWMPHTLRSTLIALRPWSFPASLVPVALAGAAVHRLHGVDLLSLDFVLSFVVVLVTHAAGNLCNTYFDFQNGVDNDKADDRTLVDKNVTANLVFTLATTLFAVAALLLAFFANRVGTHYAYVAAPAVALALFYTANPLNLKGKGLGEVIIFACFGPLLMLSVYITLASNSATSEGYATVFALSIPIGLLTVAILHANNTRDIDADQKAGIFTIAQALGKEGCKQLYVGLILGAYGLTLGMCTWFGWRCLIVLCAAPWARYIIALFDAGILEELPQRTAQHNLLFGVLLVGAISPPMFFARFLLGCLFYLGGVHNIIMWNYVCQLTHQKLNNIGLPVPLPVATVMLAVAIAVQLPCAVLFILGYHARIAAQVLLVWLVVVTFSMHDLWTIEGEEYGSGGGGSRHFSKVLERTIPNFPTEFDAEFVHFFKNVGMIGGLAIFLEMGGGLHD